MAKNLVIVEGLVLDEPPLRSTKGGLEVTNFMLEVQDPEPDSSINVCVTAFGKQAIHCATNIPRGSKVRINGKLSQSKKNKEMEILARVVDAIA